MSQLFPKTSLILGLIIQSLLITTLLPLTLQAGEPIALSGISSEISEQDRIEASNLIKNIKTNYPNSDKLAVRKSDKSEVEEAEELLEKVESIQERSQTTHAKSVNEVLNSVEKVQSGQTYKTQADWIKKNKNELLAKQAKPLPTIDYNITANAKQRENDSIAKLLSNYRFKPTDIQKNQVTNYPLMIFVSASIPRASLKDLMIQARQSGGVMVFRGLIGGTLKNTQQFLGELAKENVSAIIDPRLFEVFNVELVPTFVVLAKPTQDCEEANCNFTPIHDRIAGNFTLNYALEQFADGQGDAKSQAAEILLKLQTAAQNPIQNSIQNSGGQK